MFEKKKLTKKQIQQKYEDLKIDSRRRLEELQQRVRELELGAAQISTAVDILLGEIISHYGKYQKDGSYRLYVPKAETRYAIERRVSTGAQDQVVGCAYIAREVKKDEEVQEREDND